MNTLRQLRLLPCLALLLCITQCAATDSPGTRESSAESFTAPQEAPRMNLTAQAGAADAPQPAPQTTPQPDDETAAQTEGPASPEPRAEAPAKPKGAETAVASVFKHNPEPTVPDAQALAADLNAFKALAQAYVEAFNARDVSAMLKLYDPKARISKETDDGTIYISVDQYRRQLAEKMRGYADKGTRIVGHEIKSYKLKGDHAELVILVKVEQSIFTVRRTGAFELTRGESGWKIIKDDS